MSDTLIYVKSPKGIEEMNSRCHGLPQRARRLLIMVDGKRTMTAIAALFPDEDVKPLLDGLLADGFVAPLPVAAPATQASKTEAPIDDAKRFDMARNFMMNTVNAFVGIAGSSLITRLERATGLEELRPHYEGWREAILLSNDGRKQIADLETRLAALLS
jgi:hypothetical protein